MAQKSQVYNIAVFILILNISIGLALKTSNKHKSMISKLKSETEKQEAKSTEPASVSLPAPEVSNSSVKQSDEKKAVVTETKSSVPSSSPSSSTGKNVDKILSAKDEEDAIGLLENETIDQEEIEEAIDTAVDTNETTPGFLIKRFREVFIQLLRMFGLRTPSGKRKHRNMDMSVEEDNVLEPANYKEQIRTTVGAVLGRQDCINRAACRAGSYLRDLKGKDIIIVILEKVAPEKWLETVQVVKDSAIRNEECHYKCLED